MMECLGFGSNIGYCLFVGWVEHPDIFDWVSFLNPTYLPAMFVLSAKPNKMAEDRTMLDCGIMAPVRQEKGFRRFKIIVPVLLF